ncbi:MAG: 16S rRNA (guanine(966)-N(2))-methyltransferase RsmD [Aquiluna sp.]|nr:16S rRNA (guanine(966)-N(2))-methyltransferase RsmD [Aquiluna sp.]MCF8545301.1 16S rRNA (guanine(966)-N(2))-methyltransferase RsmD [Aquiluna sp.]
MTRIISGLAGSIPLKGPARATRPTSDRVKESLFSTLESLNVIQGASVLDLFAGTGALGLEAASRGASSITLVESDKQAAQVCRENLEKVSTAIQKSDGNCQISLAPVVAGKFLDKGPGGFDLVFLDPPYDYPNQSLGIDLRKLLASTTQDAVFVIERSSKSAAPDFEANFVQIQFKNYGDTVIHILRKLD